MVVDAIVVLEDGRLARSVIGEAHSVETAMNHPPILDDHGNDIHTGAPPIYRPHDPIFPDQQFADDVELSPRQEWMVLAIFLAAVATFAWFVFL